MNLCPVTTFRKAAQLGGIGPVEGGRRWKRVGWTVKGEKGRRKEGGNEDKMQKKIDLSFKMLEPIFILKI